MKRNQAIARESNYSIFTQSRIDLLIVLSAILLILLSVLLGIHQTRPPAAAALDAPLNEFRLSIMAFGIIFSANSEHWG
jgi:hypothetical protein